MRRTQFDRSKRLALRAEIQKALLEIDAPRFRIDANDHYTDATNRPYRLTTGNPVTKLFS